MPLSVSYTTGTASVNANGTAVTGQGTSWLTAGLEAGDYFWAAGLSVRIASVNSNTSITLAYGWPGSSRTADTYEVRYTGDLTRALASQRDVLSTLTNGNLSSIAGLTSASSKGIHYTGSGTAALHDLTAHGRAILGLSGAAGQFIRSTGANTAVMQNIVGTVSQSGGTPTGAIVERGSNSNGEYVRWADGTQICHTTFSDTTGVETASGSLFISANLTWTYPVAFSTATNLTIHGSTLRSDRIGGIAMRSSTASAITFCTWYSQTLSAGGSSFTRLTAVGRWF